MIDYAPLKAKLATPEMTALADDDARLAALIDENIVDYIELPTATIRAYLKINGFWIEIEDSADINARVARDTLNIETGIIDMRNPAVRTFFAQTINNLIGVITGLTATHRDAIMALGMHYTSWAAQNGYTPLRIGYFDKARALP